MLVCHLILERSNKIIAWNKLRCWVEGNMTVCGDTWTGEWDKHWSVRVGRPIDVSWNVRQTGQLDYFDDKLGHNNCVHGGITECEHEKRALGVEPVRNSLFRLAMCTLFQGQRRLPLVWCWYQCETTELAPWYQDPAPQSWHKRHLSSTVCCPPNPLQCHLQIESTAKIRLKFDGYIQYLRARTTNSICTHPTSIVPPYACTIPMQCKLDDGTCTARVGLVCLICW